MGDWIVGTGAVGAGNDGQLVFAMKVSEILSFDEYWRDPRFQAKKPTRRGSTKQAFGDNIYHRRRDGEWAQADSHHSYDDGSVNETNVKHDTGRTEQVLVGEDFVYFGGSGPMIPDRFRSLKDGKGICVAARGHRRIKSQEDVEAFVEWVREQGEGFIAAPGGW